QAAVAARGGLLRGASRRGHRAEHARAVPRQRPRGICRADSADRRGRRRNRRPVVDEGVVAVLSVVPSCVAMLHFRRRPTRLAAPASAALMLALALLLLAAAAPAAWPTATSRCGRGRARGRAPAETCPSRPRCARSAAACWWRAAADRAPAPRHTWVR